MHAAVKNCEVASRFMLVELFYHYIRARGLGGDGPEDINSFVVPGVSRRAS